MPDFQKIQYFIKVASTLNFTKAAQELYISPQALNKQIARLEAVSYTHLTLPTICSV